MDNALIIPQVTPGIPSQICVILPLRGYLFVFDNREYLIHRDLREVRLRAGRPGDFDFIHNGCGSDTEVQARVVLRDITAAAAHAVPLRQVLGLYPNSGPDCRPVALTTLQIQSDPDAVVRAV